MLLTATPWAQSQGSRGLGLFPVLPVWDQPLDRVVATPPAFAGHRGFFPVQDGHVEAFDVETGAAAWTAAGSPLSTPATGDGLLYLAEADAIVALRQDTGAVAWRLPFTARLAVPLVWDNGWLIAADDAGALLAYRAVDGTLIWRQELGVKIHASPALAEDRVYAPLEDGHVVALDVATGARRWSHQLGGPANDMLALPDRIYVGSDDNFFYCLHAATGELAWRWRTGGDVIGVPVIDEHRVFFVSKDNVLRGLDRQSGAQRWQRPLPGRPTRGLVAAGNLLLVSGLSPRVAVFVMNDGSPAGDLTAPGELAAAPYVTDSHGLPQVVLVSRDVTQGTRVSAVRRLVDPPMNTPMPALPNPVTIAKPGTPGDPFVTVPPPAGSEPSKAPRPSGSRP